LRYAGAAYPETGAGCNIGAVAAMNDSGFARQKHLPHH
jgi:hypothetical protein